MVRRFYNFYSDLQLVNIDKFFNKNIKRNWHFQQSVKSDFNFFLYSDLKSEEIFVFFPKIQKILSNLDPTLKYLLSRAYINCYPAYINSEFHHDDGDLTVLYYPNSNYDYGEKEGGTEFYEMTTEPYIANSLIVFPAHLPHRAQQHFNLEYRFTLAFKFQTIIKDIL